MPTLVGRWLLQESIPFQKGLVVKDRSKENVTKLRRVRNWRKKLLNAFSPLNDELNTTCGGDKCLLMQRKGNLTVGNRLFFYLEHGSKTFVHHSDTCVHAQHIHGTVKQKEK